MSTRIDDIGAADADAWADPPVSQGAYNRTSATKLTKLGAVLESFPQVRPDTEAT